MNSSRSPDGWPLLPNASKFQGSSSRASSPRALVGAVVRQQRAVLERADAAVRVGAEADRQVVVPAADEHLEAEPVRAVLRAAAVGRGGPRHVEVQRQDRVHRVLRRDAAHVLAVDAPRARSRRCRRRRGRAGRRGCRRRPPPARARRARRAGRPGRGPRSRRRSGRSRGHTARAASPAGGRRSTRRSRSRRRAGRPRPPTAPSPGRRGRSARGTGRASRRPPPSRARPACRRA